MAADLRFFWMDLNEANWPRLRVKIILNYQLKHEVTKANFTTYEIIYKWQPFIIYSGRWKSDPSVVVIILLEYTFQPFPAEVGIKMLPWVILEDDLLETF